MFISKPGRTKQQLLDCLENLKQYFRDEINAHDIRIQKINDGYNLYAQKKILLLNFYVNANIIVYDGGFDITYGTNAPQSKVKEALNKINYFLSQC